MNKYAFVLVLIFAILISSNAFAELEITTPDNEFYVVAKYDFEANNPENFDTPYYWWAVFDKQEKKFLEKYFQKEITEQEALNNNLLEDVVFLNPVNYRIAVVYCPVFVSDPTDIDLLETSGCSYAKIDNLNVNDFEIWGTIRGTANIDLNPIYSDSVQHWQIKEIPEHQDLFYSWGIYSFDSDEIIQIEENLLGNAIFFANLGLGKYTVGVVICNHELEVGEEDPLEFFDEENCTKMGRQFEVVETIHMEPSFVQSGDPIIIKGSLSKTDWSSEYDKIKTKINYCVGYDCEELGELELFDDGQHEDEEANDDVWGIYGNTQNQPIGKYELESRGYLNEELQSFTNYSYAYIIESPNKCLKLLDNGPIEDKLDILFIGESFETLNNLLEAINVQQEYFIGEYGIEPYKQNNTKINMHVSTYLLQNLCDTDSRSCNFDASNYLHCPYDKVIYFTKGLAGISYASLGGTVSIVLLGSGTDYDWHAYTTVHEFGHSFGSLRDEYTLTHNGDSPGFPNCADSIDEAMNWWGDKIGEGEGSFQVLSQEELSILGHGMKYFEFVDQYGGYPEGNIEYNKCRLNLNDCINKDDFLGIQPAGCSYSTDNFRPTKESIMRNNAAFADFLNNSAPFNEYKWWNHGYGPVNEAHVASLLEEYE